MFYGHLIPRRVRISARAKSNVLKTVHWTSSRMLGWQCFSSYKTAAYRRHVTAIGSVTIKAIIITAVRLSK